MCFSVLWGQAGVSSGMTPTCTFLRGLYISKGVHWTGEGASDTTGSSQAKEGRKCTKDHHMEHKEVGHLQDWHT